MDPVKKKQLVGTETDMSYYVKHYLHLIWRWKWYAFLAAPVAGGLFILTLTRSGSIRPQLAATALLGYQGDTPVIGSGTNPQSFSIEHMQTRQFIREIVDTLSLRLLLEKRYPRHEIWSSVDVDAKTPEGDYHFTPIVPGNRYRLVYENPNDSKGPTTVQEGTLPKDSVIDRGGLNLVFASSFSKSPFDFSFKVTSMRKAVDRTLAMMESHGPDPRRDIHHITLNVKGYDYQLISEIANTIADKYVQHNLKFKRNKTSTVLENLDAQLKRAEQQLAGSQDVVERYLANNPGVGLSTATERVLNQMVDLETENQLESGTAQQAQQLRKRLRGTTGYQQMQTAKEALLFLSSQGNVSAQVMQQNLSEATEYYDRIRDTHAPDHPQVRNAYDRVQTILSQVEGTLSKYVSSINDANRRRSANLNRLTTQLRGLPKQELQYAKLRQRQEVDAEIYSTVFSRYNEARVAQAAQAPDIYVMDHSVPPRPPATLVRILQVLGLATLVGLGAALVPPVTVDLFDHSPRSEMDVQRKLELPVLEAIPVISPRSGDEDPGNLQADPRVTMFLDESHIVNEFFRSLRTKLDLLMQQHKKKAVVFTSLDMSEGKSIITANMAVSFARQGKKVLLVDADMRKGVLDEIFHARHEKGLSEMLYTSDESPDRLLAQSIQPLPIKNLFFLSSGKNPNNPVELLGSPVLGAMGNGAASSFDVVLVDTPPLGVGADVAAMHRLNALYVVVIKSGSTDMQRLKRRVNEYSVVRDNLAGAVLNYSDVDTKQKYYRYSGYYKRSKG